MSKKEVFEVAVFDSFDDSNAIVIEGGLSYEDALEKATNIFETGEQDNYWTVALSTGAIVTFTQDRIRITNSYTLRRGISDEEMKKIIS
jgi:hypothetical protein